MTNLLWNGTPAEYGLLYDAINHNCTCDKAFLCEVHKLLKTQKFIDHLLFARRIVKQLREEEYCATKEQSPS